MKELHQLYGVTKGQRERTRSHVSSRAFCLSSWAARAQIGTVVPEWGSPDLSALGHLSQIPEVCHFHTDSHTFVLNR